MVFKIDPPPIYDRVSNDDHKLHQTMQQWLVETQRKLNETIIADTYTATNNTTQTIAIDEMTANDTATVTTKKQGSNSESVVSAEAKDNGIEVTFSGAPGTGHVLYYQVVRRF